MCPLEWPQIAPGRFLLPSHICTRVLAVAATGALMAGWTAIPSSAQTPSTPGANSLLLPPSHEEVAEEERATWSLKKFPAQPYMREYNWQFPSDTIPFFRDSLVQYVARSYYFTRDNFDGTRTQALAGGGWIGFRSGLIGDMFGVHTVYYTSQKLFGPLDEDGTKLLAPGQNSL